MTSVPDLNASISRRGYAMSLMVFGSVVLSFTGLKRSYLGGPD